MPVRPDSIARSLAIGNPADGDFAVATARSTGGAIYTVPEDEIGDEHGRARRHDGRLRRDGDGRHARRAQGRRSPPGGSGPQSRVVLLVTGDGLKTPGPVAHTYDPVMIEADADAFVDEVLVA